MTTAQLIIICVTVLLLAAIAASAALVAFLLLAGEDGDEPALAATGATVVVHTTDGRSVRGTVTTGEAGVVALEHAAYLAGGAEQPMGGVARIPVTSVALIQDVTALRPVPDKVAAA